MTEPDIQGSMTFEVNQEAYEKIMGRRIYADARIVATERIDRPSPRHPLQRLAWVRKYGRGRPFVKVVTKLDLYGVTLDV